MMEASSDRGSESGKKKVRTPVPVSVIVGNGGIVIVVV
jgi:hypothetical protein